MAFDIHRRSSDILQKGQVGFNGLVVPDNRNIERTFTLVGGQTSQVDRIAVSASPAAGDIMAFTIARAIDSSSASFSFTLPTLSSGSYTTATAAQAIVDAFNADASFTKMAFATRDSSDVVLTAIFPGADYAFTTTLGTQPSGATLTLTAGAAPVDATDALFADVLMAGPQVASNFLNVAADFGHDSERIGEMIAGKFGAAIDIADRTATITLANTANSAGVLSVIVSAPGFDQEIYNVAIANTNTIDTVGSALATKIGSNSAIMTAANAGGVVTLTTKQEGVAMRAAASLSAGAMTVAIAHSDDPIAGGTQESMVGIVVYDPTDADTDVLGSNSTGVKAGTEGRMLEEGYFLMKPTDSASFDTVFNKSVYVGQTDAETGRIFLTYAEGRVKWDRCIVKQAVRGGFYVLRLLPLRA